MEVLTPHPTIGIAECGSQYYSQINSIDRYSSYYSQINSIDRCKKKHYYVYKDGHCLSDYDTYEEASEHSKRINGEVFIEYIDESTGIMYWEDAINEQKDRQKQIIL